MVAAAIIGGAVVAGTASTVASHSAAGATESAASNAITAQQTAAQNQANLEQPYRGLGKAALPGYEALLGIGPGANAQTIQQALAATPGYQFTQQQGEQGILNAASASGGFSGNTATALDQYNTGLADQTYQNALTNAQGAVGLGQAAASNTAANIGTAAGNVSNLISNQGTNLANIDIGEAAGISNALGNAGNQYTENQTIGALLNSGGGNAYTSQYSGGYGAGAGGVDAISDGYQRN